MESNAPQTQIVDLTGGEIAETEDAGVPELAHCNQNRIGSGPCQISTSQAAGPITRYVMSYFHRSHAPHHGTIGLICQTSFAGPSHDLRPSDCGLFRAVPCDRL